MSGRIPLVLFEPLPVIGEALCRFLATQADFEPVVFSDLGDFLASLTGAMLILLSVHGLPGDWGSVRRVIHLAPPQGHVALLAREYIPQMCALAIAEGANGVVHEGANPVAFLAALRRIARGDTVVMSDAKPVPNPLDDATASVEHALLSARETDIIRLLAEDRTAQQVASVLGISVRTVHGHLQRAYRKLGVQGRLGAVVAARRRGILEI
jgi:DNA-binding NarL/FixJ family response regulator